MKKENPLPEVISVGGFFFIFYMPLIERRSEVALGDKNVLVCLSGRGKTFLNKSLDIHFVII